MLACKQKMKKNITKEEDLTSCRAGTGTNEVGSDQLLKIK